MKRDGAAHSLWQDTTIDYSNQKIASTNQLFDVIIAGGGITGITTGILLQIAGKSVLIAEAQSIGFGTTGGTTAHLNTFMDTPYNAIRKKFGENNAQLVGKAVSQALEVIKRNVEEYNIDCDYKELPGYLFSQDEKQSAELEDILTATQDCNVEVSPVMEIPVPLSF